MDTSLSSVFPLHNAEVVRTKNFDSALWKENNPSSAFGIKGKHLSFSVYTAPGAGICVFYQCRENKWDLF